MKKRKEKKKRKINSELLKKFTEPKPNSKKCKLNQISYNYYYY
jgi:hypothetical protein